MGAMNVGQAAPYIEAFSVARGAAATIYDIIERKSAIDPTSSEGEKPSSVKGMIGKFRECKKHGNYLLDIVDLYE